MKNKSFPVLASRSFSSYVHNLQEVPKLSMLMNIVFICFRPKLVPPYAIFRTAVNLSERGLRRRNREGYLLLSTYPFRFIRLQI